MRGPSYGCLECHEPSRSLALNRNKRDPASLSTLSVRIYRYFDILIERCQHSHQLFHRNQFEMAPEQLGQGLLLDLDQLRGIGLRNLPLRHQPFQLNEGQS